MPIRWVMKKSADVPEARKEQGITPPKTAKPIKPNAVPENKVSEEKENEKCDECGGMNGKHKKGCPEMKEESKEKMEEQVTFDFSTIFAGDETLSEEFKTKAASLFEALVTARTTEIKEQVMAEANEKIAEANEIALMSAAQLVEEKVAELTAQVDDYMNYVAEQWLENNKVAVENGLRTEVTEDFINGLRNLFAEHYIEVPEERYNVIGEMESKIEELENLAKEKMNESVALSSELAAMKKQSIINEMSAGMAQTEAEKLKTLASEISFEDAESFAEKMNVIKENYFPRNAQPTEQNLIEADDSVTGIETETSSSVLQYAQAIAKTTFTK